MLCQRPATVLAQNELNIMAHLLQDTNDPHNNQEIKRENSTKDEDSIDELMPEPGHPT